MRHIYVTNNVLSVSQDLKPKIMELAIHQELEAVSHKATAANFTTKGLLNSNYKSVVSKNFSKTSRPSIFNIRQDVKSSQFRNVNHIAAILKLSVFFIALVIIF